MKRSIPIHEVLDTPSHTRDLAPPFDVGCRFDGCGGYISERFGGLPICGNHGDAVANQAGVKAKPKRRNAPEVNRHGIPLRGGDPQGCIWPSCGSTAILRETKMCQRHASTVAAIVERDRRIMQEPLPPPRQPEPEPKPTDSVIYYVRVAEHIKIGWTSRLEQRMRQFPPNSQLLATEPGARADEAKLHKMFAVHRAYGSEWYAPTPTVLHHIEMVKQKHGEPDQVTVGAKPVTIPQPREPQYIGGTTRLLTGRPSKPLRG